MTTTSSSTSTSKARTCARSTRSQRCGVAEAVPSSTCRRSPRSRTGSGNTVYSAAKGAITVLTRNLALELAPIIRVNAILPVAADTPFMIAAFGERMPEEAKQAMRAGIPMARLCEPADVAHAVAFLASDDSSFMTGVSMTLDGGRSLT